MQKKIVVCIGTDRGGNVRARFSLLLMDGDDVMNEHYHSMSIAATDDLAAARRAVESHLAMPKEKSGIPLAPWPAIPDAEWDKVVRVCEVFHPAR
jgi:hypothetical protein